MDEYPYLKALLLDAESVTVRWGFDEQQAEPIHQHWTWDKAKEELKKLLESAVFDLCGTPQGSGVMKTKIDWGSIAMADKWLKANGYNYKRLEAAERTMKSVADLCPSSRDKEISQITISFPSISRAVTLDARTHENAMKILKGIRLIRKMKASGLVKEMA